MSDPARHLNFDRASIKGSNSVSWKDAGENMDWKLLRLYMSIPGILLSFIYTTVFNQQEDPEGRIKDTKV